MRGFVSVLIVVLLLVPVPASAALNPTMMSSMRVEVQQEVMLSLDGNVNSLEVSLMIPQEDKYQTIRSMEVSEPYEIIIDDYGNEMVKVNFDDPGANPSFTVKSIVDIARRTSAELPKNTEFTTPTGLIQSDDTEIIGLAETLTTGKKTGFEKMAAVTGWVNENIEYDLAYAEVNLSAKKVLQLKAGVCDEYSALTMAMLRGIGHRTAYVVGYAYGRGYRIAEDFVPHGWVEACSGGECYLIDPTWGEAGWLDASHIKFATLPESYYVEATAGAKGTGRITVNLDSVNTKIKILDSAQSPLITTEARLLDEEIWEGHAVLRTDLTTQGCVLTKVMYGSCLQNNGKQLLTPETDETTLYFCGKRTSFVPFSIPEDLKENVVYTCALTVAPTASNQKDIEVTLNPREKGGEAPTLGVDRTAVKAGETVEARAAGAEIFTSDGKYGAGEMKIIAPADDFRIYAYRNGHLSFQDIKVIETRPLDIKLVVPVNMTAEEEGTISVEIKNIDTRSRDVSVRFREDTQGKQISAGKTETFVFEFVADESNNIVQVFVESDGFSTSSSETLNITPLKKNFLEQLIEAIRNFFASIFGG